jgi:hypothetical protein
MRLDIQWWHGPLHFNLVVNDTNIRRLMTTGFTEALAEHTNYARPMGNGWSLIFCVMVYLGQGGVWCVGRRALR